MSTTAQRGSTTGQWRYNTTTGKFEGKGASEFIENQEPYRLGSVDVTEVDPLPEHKLLLLQEQIFLQAEQ